MVAEYPHDQAATHSGREHLSRTNQVRGKLSGQELAIRE